MALADMVLADGDFWTGPAILALPVHAELPTDLLLRQLPEPGVELGGQDLLAFLAPLFARFPEPPE